MRFTQPEVDSQLQHMKKLEQAQAQALLNLGLPLKVLVAVPQPAEGLDKNRRAHEKQQQDREVQVGLFLVKRHSGKNIQPYVEQQEHQTQTSEEEVNRGVLEHTHNACQTKVHT